MKFYFTTSWDDGSAHDIRLLALLDKYGIKGTFYIPEEFNYSGDKFSEYGQRLSEEEIRTISKTQEIGAHSLSHRILTKLPDFELQKEIAGSKLFLEEITGKKILMFCPPGGLANERAINSVKNAGYEGMRTTDKLNFILSEDKFKIGVSIQAAPFPFRKKDCSSFYWRKLLSPLFNYKLLAFPSLWPGIFSWELFAKTNLRYALGHGNYFHLYGHSWELEKYGMWDELEAFLSFIKQFDDILFVTNSEITELIK